MESSNEQYDPHDAIRREAHVRVSYFSFQVN